ncbi:transposase [Bacteroidota bacterium]
MQKLTIPNYSIEEMEALLNSNPDYIVGMRLIALIQIKKGMSSRQLQELYYKSHSRFCVWANNFNKKGIEGLKNKPKSGRKPKLGDAQLEEIKNVLLAKRPIDYGYNSGTWNGPLLIDFIKKRYGIKYKKAQVYNIIKGLGFTFQKGRAKYFEADENKRKEFRETVKKTPGRT